MQNEIKVSVLCAAYNHEKFIRSALDGFVMQKTDFAFEVLVHDDASTDKTADIIKEYADKHPQIIKPIFQTENQYSKKVSITNDILAPMTRGKYIAFCEGDDFWTDENKLRLQVEFLESHPDYIACAHNTTIHDCGGKMKDELMVLQTEEHDVAFENAVWGMRGTYQTSSLMFRREYLFDMPEFYYTALKHGFGDHPRAIWYTLVGKIRFLPYNMSTYRFRSNPVSWSASMSAPEKLVRHKLHSIEMLESVKKYVSDERSRLVDEVILKEKFDILEAEGRYSEMKKTPFSRLWRTQSFKVKLRIFLKANCPQLYRMMKKIRYGIRRTV